MKRTPCTNSDGTQKRGYAHRSSANRAAKRTYQARRNDGIVKVYRCPQCHLFHVGHDGRAD